MHAYAGGVGGPLYPIGSPVRSIPPTKQMNRSRVPAGYWLAIALAAATPKLIAQSTPAVPPASADGEVIELSPFSVSATEDQGYTSKYTLAGTRIRTELKDVGSSISVYTSKFLENTGSTNAEQLLVYTSGTEVAGQGGNFLGMGDGSVLTDTNRTKPISNTRVRGLTEADNTRDFNLSDIPWDSYNVGRIDLQRGPNSILFGIGSPAGIVNGSLNQASFKDSNKVENKVDNFGTYRFSLDINKAILRNELAVRLSALYDDTEYKQQPAYRLDRRVYGAVNYVPSFLKKNGNRTSLTANFEKGAIRSNNPRFTPPLDAITPWFTKMGKATFDAKTSAVASNTNFWLGAPGQRVWDGLVTAFSPEGVQGDTYSASIRNWPNNGATAPSTVVGDNVLKGINTYNVYGTRANLPFSDINAYKAVSLQDASVFDFYNHLIEGPNKREWNDFKAFDIALSQSFFNDKLAFNLSYDKQHAKWGYENFLSGDAAVVTVDIMKTLIDGSANPYVGKPMTIAGGGSAGGYWQERTWEVARGQVYYDLNFADITGKDSLMNTLFGRNVLTGQLSQQTQENENRAYNRFYLPANFAPNASAGSVGQASRDDIFYMYLGGDLSGRSSAAGANLQAVQNRVVPAATTVNYYNNTANAWQKVNLSLYSNDSMDDSSKTYRTARKYKQVIDSKVLVWQGFWLDNALVPMFGWRKDTEKFRDAGNAPSLGDGLINPQSAAWVLGNTGKQSGINRTYSLVGHIPKSLRANLPGNLDVSLFVNQSENFQPDASRRDIRGNTVASPSGKTKEFGASVTLLDDRLTIKWTHYKTSVTNASVTNEIGGQYLIGAVEAWGQRAAYKFKNEPGNWPADTVYGTSTSGKAVTWRPAGALKKNAEGGFTYTQAEIDATYAKEQASITDWFAHQVPTDFQSAWALTNYGSATYGGDTNYGASGLTVTGDTESKGDEFEIMANPVKGWDISFNAAKTSARRFNLAKSYTDWILQRWELFKGPMGDMRLWGGADDSSADSTHDGETARGKFKRETMAGYNLWNALQNTNVPELRPWRYNVINNYSFQNGALKGMNVGGSYRWQQANVTGFPVITDAAGAHVYDVTKPYKGKADSAIDLWVGYQKKITQKINWRVQLNVRNIFASKDLLPVTVQPDGSAAAFRIPEPRTFTLTNTFEF